MTFAKFLVSVTVGKRRQRTLRGLADHAGLPTSQPFEELVSTAVWNVDILRDDVRTYVLEKLADNDGILILDDTQVIKKGTKSVGVARQYCGLTGHVENCQSMVMMSYAPKWGHAFIDRELYLPEEWTDNRPRCHTAGVPDDLGFATKPQLTNHMLTRALQDAHAAILATARPA